MNSRLSSFVVLIAGASFFVPQAAQSETHPKSDLGVYQKDVYDKIGYLWYRHIKQNNSQSIRVGIVRISFRITANGQVENLKVLSNTSNQKGADIVVHSIREAKFALMPKSVSTALTKKGQDWLEEEITFTFQPNKI